MLGVTGGKNLTGRLPWGEVQWDNSTGDGKHPKEHFQLDSPKRCKYESRPVMSAA